MKVVVAIDSFKGSLESGEIGLSAKKGILNVYPKAEVVVINMADGGEGTVNALVSESHGKLVNLIVHNPLCKQIESFYGIMGDSNTAVIEMAAASGLPLIKESERNPMLTSTYGTGELIKDAIEKGCREFIVGIGGSATNDAGTGMLQALGYSFFDSSNNPIDGCGKNLYRISYIDDSNVNPYLKDCKFTVACDVDNPFYGINGAAFVYGKQKGATDEMIRELDNGMRSFAKVIDDKYNVDVSNFPGAGAAGGLGGCFYGILGAELRPGIEIIIETVQLEKILRDADFVITGEGRLDEQTAMGKTPVGVAKLAKKYNIPVIAICGSVGDGSNMVHEAGIDTFFSIINRPVSLQSAMDRDNAMYFAENTAEQIFRLIKAIGCRGIKNVSA